ncbi:hypothetical protein CEXT_28301 [Caerostris extrusa]|uniref:Uncharacterized protein n=1 Tax=Caerostris extrusa TaxID=172846 RepID=A0AAV4TKY8_CAEEX|nr:hypothetical protein CEXT_28301 [Caerostris extrusa]
MIPSSLSSKIQDHNTVICSRPLPLRKQLHANSEGDFIDHFKNILECFVLCLAYLSQSKRVKIRFPNVDNRIGT